MDDSKSSLLQPWWPWKIVLVRIAALRWIVQPSSPKTDKTTVCIKAVYTRYPSMIPTDAIGAGGPSSRHDATTANKMLRRDVLTRTSSDKLIGLETAI